MYEASQPGTSPEVHHWIAIFDYVGYVLFFNAIFFVVHAFSIILWSIRTSFDYGKFHDSSLADITQSIDNLKKNYVFRHLYESNYNPFLPLPRQMAEFKVIHVLFRDTFGIPTDFAFGDYLGKCFERYSLNIIHLSLTSWVMMLILYGFNMVRIYTPSVTFHCVHSEPHDSTSTSEPSHRRSLLYDLSSGSIYGGGIEYDYDSESGSNSTHDDHHSVTDDHHSSELNEEDKNISCDEAYVRLFCVCALVILCYGFLIFFIGRVYTLRLLRKAGVEGIHGVDDDLTFFLAAEATRALNEKEETEKSKEKERESSNSKSSSSNPDNIDDIILLHRGNTRSQQSRRMSLATFSKKIGELRIIRFYFFLSHKSPQNEQSEEDLNLNLPQDCTILERLRRDDMVVVVVL